MKNVKEKTTSLLPLTALTLTIGCGLSPVSWADDLTTPPISVDYKPQWELGVAAGSVNVQAYPGSKERVSQSLIVPTFIYRSPKLNVTEDGLKIKSLRTPLYSIDFDGSGSLAYSSDSGARKDLPKLGYLIELGPQITFNIKETENARWTFGVPLRTVFDLSNQFAYRGLTLEPSLNLRLKYDNLYLYESVGAVLSDQRRNQLTYGVDSSYVTDNRPEYRAKSGLVTWRVKSGVGYKLNNKTRVYGFVRFDNISGSANEDSPLVETKTGLSYGLGVNYLWRTSKLRVPTERD